MARLHVDQASTTHIRTIFPFASPHGDEIERRVGRFQVDPGDGPRARVASQTLGLQELPVLVTRNGERMTAVGGQLEGSAGSWWHIVFYAPGLGSHLTLSSATGLRATVDIDRGPPMPCGDVEATGSVALRRCGVLAVFVWPLPRGVHGEALAGVTGTSAIGTGGKSLGFYDLGHVRTRGRLVERLAIRTPSTCQAHVPLALTGVDLRSGRHIAVTSVGALTFRRTGSCSV